jgi:hypothetical protein
MKSPKWNQIYMELFRHQDLMEIFMKAMNEKAKRLAFCEKKLADLSMHE